MIISTFLDRPLSFSGRIIVSKDNEIYSKLVDDDKATMIIPNVANIIILQKKNKTIKFFKFIKISENRKSKF